MISLNLRPSAIRLLGHLLKRPTQISCCHRQCPTRSLYTPGTQRDPTRSQWTSSLVRRKFIDYWTGDAARGPHEFIAASSLVPRNDPTLELTNAGMNQFKHILLGTCDADGAAATEPRRVANYQRCIRVGGKHCDLEMVGHNFRHHTFFEMLGNWSFNGAYGKEEACRWALDFLVDVLKLDKNRLVVSYFGGDSTSDQIPPDEATRDIWLRLGFPSDRVIPCGMSDNFWEMGPTGPCGVCTELYYLADVKPWSRRSDEILNHCLEVWNVVFIEYNRRPDGGLDKLASGHVDTGMGLERILAVLNGVHSNYDTDLFRPLMDTITRVTRCRPYTGDLDDLLDVAYRILADHSRMITALAGEGLVGTRTGPGHYLRNIIKRCHWLVTREHGWPRELSIKLLKELSNDVHKSLGEAYPDLRSPEISTHPVIDTEVDKYETQIANIGRAFKKMTSSGDYVSGDQIFRLVSEQGATRPLLEHLSRQHGNKELDWEGFEELADEHRAKNFNEQ